MSDFMLGLEVKMEGAELRCREKEMKYTYHRI
jgi:hypothetical protein